jgi:hypothetical protein
VMDVDKNLDVRVALPTPKQPMLAHGIHWGVELPGSDIVVMRIDVEASACFVASFESLLMGQDVESTAIPASMLETDVGGNTRLAMRCVKGYVSYGRDNWIAANFPLLKGMSGAPIVASVGDNQYVAGVFVGQTRGEEIEDQVQEVTETKDGKVITLVEKVARVEYHARGELLRPYADFRVKEFEGLTLRELIAKDLKP